MAMRRALVTTAVCETMVRMVNQAPVVKEGGRSEVGEGEGGGGRKGNVKEDTRGGKGRKRKAKNEDYGGRRKGEEEREKGEAKSGDYGRRRKKGRRKKGRREEEEREKGEEERKGCKGREGKPAEER